MKSSRTDQKPLAIPFGRARNSVVRVGLALALFCAANQCLPGTDSGDDDMEALGALLLSNGLNATAPTVTCPAGTSLPAGLTLADTVTSAPAHTGSGYKDKTKAVNGICGGGSATGGTDVFSLDATGSGASLVLEWAGQKVTNGSGIDFVVFENPFSISSSSSRFMDPAVVEVSRDNVTYCGFGPDYTNAPETSYSTNPVHWSKFAGLTPVLLNQVTNPLTAADSFDPNKAGGDGFDLSNLVDTNQFGNGCSTVERNAIQTNGFVYIRIRSASALVNPDTGSAFVHDAISDGADIDGVISRYMATR
ncbi:MAG: LIC_13355 family lipoprotein [Leptospiraceae bacterium]|nr:LIC_13355 family lipoprotein [Leptospiraceae bacterium]